MQVTRWKLAYVAGMLLAAAPGIGRAEGWGAQGSRDLLTPLGEYVLLGGGVTGFTDTTAKDLLGVGGSWDARVGIGSRFYVGAELAYVGSFRGGKSGGSDLTMNGAEGVLRVQYPYATGSWLIEPFAFGGIGWNHLSVRNPAPGVKDSDDIGVVPFGAGVTVGYGRVLFDARFTYRTTFSDNVALASNAGPVNLQHWTAGASVGVEF